MKKKIFTIYKATNKFSAVKAGKQMGYIGYTYNWPGRKQSHFLRSKLNRSKSAFHLAIRKYGPDAFEWKILYQSKNEYHTLKIMEEYFIRQENTHSNDGWGYNMTYGGEGISGLVQTAETRKKMRATHKGKAYSKGCKHTQQARENMRQAQIGRKHSPETLAKMREAALKRGEQYNIRMSIIKKGHSHTRATKKKISRLALDRSAKKRAAQVTHNVEYH